MATETAKGKFEACDWCFEDANDGNHDLCNAALNVTEHLGAVEAEATTCDWCFEDLSLDHTFCTARLSVDAHLASANRP